MSRTRSQSVVGVAVSMVLLAAGCGADEARDAGSACSALGQSGRFSAAAADVAKIRALLETPVMKAMATPALPPSSHPMINEVQRRLGNLFVQHNKYGTVSVLLSPRVTIPVGSVDASVPYDKAATMFLASYPGLLGMDPSHDVLQVNHVDQHSKGAVVKLTQTHDGVPCRGAFVTVALDVNRMVRGLLSQTMPLGTTPATPKIVVSTPSVLLPGESTTGQPELHFIDRARWTTGKLAWKVPAKDAEGRAVDYWVDAETGTSIAREEKADEAVTWNRVLWDQIASKKIREENPFYCEYCAPKTTPCGCSGMSAGEQASWEATEAVASYLDGRGYSSWDGQGSSMHINIAYTSNGNGLWDRQSNEVSVHPNCYTSQEIVAHEWGHGIADGIDFSLGDPRALGEGFADCFAMMVYDNNWQWNESNPPLCNAAARDAQWALNGGYRNYTLGDDHKNGQIVSHICYAASFLTSAQPGPFACSVAWGCPGFWQAPLRVDCLDGHCVSWSNAVPVPYHGRSQGYGPIFNTLTQQAGYSYLDASSDFEHLVGALTLAGCTYDELELGQPVCSVMGQTNYLASLAAGIWFSPLFVNHGSSVSINTDRRPALISSAKTGTQDNWAATFYREGRSTDHSKLKYTYDLGDPSGAVETPQIVLSQGNPVLAGSGLTAVRNPVGLGADVSLFFKDASSSAMRYLTGTLGASSISWSTLNTVTQVQTDQAPEAINYGTDLWYVWKEAGGTTIRAMTHGSPQGSPILAGGNTIHTPSAPTVVSAADRLWVFYRHASNNLVYYTCLSARGTWMAPVALEGTTTNWDPEAIYYQPLGGGSGRRADLAVLQAAVRRERPGRRQGGRDADDLVQAAEHLHGRYRKHVATSLPVPDPGARLSL